MGQSLRIHRSRSTYGTIDSGDGSHPEGANVNQRQSSGLGSSGNSQTGASSSNATESEYEELMKNAMTCPTCKGLGQVSRDQEDELVAIIPLSDQRLKPRRTWLIIITTILICALIAGLVLFFIVPRAIVASSLKVDRIVEPLNVTLEEFKESFFFEVKYRMNISYMEPISLANDNFFPVQVTRIQIDLNHAEPQRDSSLVLTLVLHYDNGSLGDMTVPVRSSATLSSELLLSLDSRDDKNDAGFSKVLIKRCIENPNLYSFVSFVANATIYYDYLGNSQRQTLSYERNIGCYPYNDIMSTYPSTVSTTPFLIAVL